MLTYCTSRDLDQIGQYHAAITKHWAGSGGGFIPIINIQFLFSNGVCFRERITLRILLRSFLQ